MDKLVASLARYVAIGAAVAFGWIFGENAATKVVDRMDSHADKKKERKRIEQKS